MSQLPLTPKRRLAEIGCRCLMALANLSFGDSFHSSVAYLHFKRFSEGILLYAAQPTPPHTPPPKQTCTFSPPLWVPSLLPSHLIPAAMSSGSALSHLINRNLCYNDLSMSLWLYAYSMRAGNPVALVADSEAFFTHTVAPRCLWARRPTGWREAGTFLEDTYGPNISRAPALLLCAVFPSPLIICSLHYPHDFSGLLILMPVIYLIK